MNNKFNSTLQFKSNIESLQKDALEDWNFLAKIHDPFALTELEKQISKMTTRYRLNPIQDLEKKRASTKCMFAVDDDYPWGTIISGDQRKVVCKCLKISCHRFKECRPNFTTLELDVFKQNLIAKLENIYEIIKIDSLKEKEKLKVKLIIDQEKTFEIKNELDNIYNKESDFSFKEKNKRDINYNYSVGNSNIIPTLENTNGLTVLIEHKTGGSSDKLIKENIMEPVIYSEDHYISNSKSERLDLPMHGKETKSIFELEGFHQFRQAEQIEVIMKEANDRILVNAGPGTGKTWTLVKRIIKLVMDDEIDPQSIQVLCFSRSAVEVIRNRLREAVENGDASDSILSVYPSTFDSAATRILAWVKDNSPDNLPASFKLELLDYDSRIESVIDVMSKINSISNQWEHLIVDEVQDLVGVRARFIINLLESLPDRCGFTLTGDSCQAIYDYQVQDQIGEIDSAGFYQWIFRNYRDIDYVEFRCNHRQLGSHEGFDLDYREAILKGDPSSCLIAFRKIKDKIINLSTLKIEKTSKMEIEQIRGNGTLAILCRTNGLSLKISTWLRNSNVDHVIQRPVSEALFAGWIGRVFTSYENDTINHEAFIKCFLKVYPQKEMNEADACWDAIKNTINNDKDRYQVSDLLKGIIRNSKDSILFQGEKETPVVVSNIHRVKGKEYDSVIILDDLIEEISKGSTVILDEHKVIYVAMTRSRKNLLTTGSKRQYIYIDKNKGRRCFQQSYGLNGRAGTLTHVEIGLKKDVDPISFAISKEIQDIICNKVKVGARLRLVKKTIRITEYYYELIIEDEQENISIGKASIDFSEGLKKIIRRIKKLPRNIEPYQYFYPDALNDVYIDDIITYLHPSGIDVPGAKRFGDICIWNGISIIGFAQTEYNRY